jgi:hypothetical protein
MIFPGQSKMVYPVLYWWGRTKEGNKEAYSLNFEFWKGISAFLLLTTGLFFVPDKYMWIFMFLSILQWCCILVFLQHNTDRYMSVAIVFVMYYISYFSFTYLGFYGFVIPLCLTVYYITNLIPSMRQYETMQDFFDYHAFHDPKLPNCRLEEVKVLLAKDDFHSRIRAMCLITELVLRYRMTDYNTLRFAADITRLWGNLDEAVTLSSMALSKPYIGWDEVAKEHHKVFMERIAKDVEILKERNRQPSRQVKRQMDRKSKTPHSP